MPVSFAPIAAVMSSEEEADSEEEDNGESVPASHNIQSLENHLYDSLHPRYLPSLGGAIDRSGVSQISSVSASSDCFEEFNLVKNEVRNSKLSQDNALGDNSDCRPLLPYVNSHHENGAVLKRPGRSRPNLENNEANQLRIARSCLRVNNQLENIYEPFNIKEEILKKEDLSVDYL